MDEHFTYAVGTTTAASKNRRPRGVLKVNDEIQCRPESATPSSFAQTASTSTSSAFTGQTHGGGPSGNGFTFPLCAIRRVERLNSQNFQVLCLGIGSVDAPLANPDVS